MNGLYYIDMLYGVAVMCVGGTDCLVANTLEANGIPSGIVVSHSTRDYINNEYDMEEIPAVEVRGVDVRCYCIRFPLKQAWKRLRTKYEKEAEVKKEAAGDKKTREKMHEDLYHIKANKDNKGGGHALAYNMNGVHAAPLPAALREKRPSKVNAAAVAAAAASYMNSPLSVSTDPHTHATNISSPSILPGFTSSSPSSMAMNQNANHDAFQKGLPTVDSNIQTKEKDEDDHMSIVSLTHADQAKPTPRMHGGVAALGINGNTSNPPLVAPAPTVIVHASALPAISSAQSSNSTLLRQSSNNTNANSMSPVVGRVNSKTDGATGNSAAMAVNTNTGTAADARSTPTPRSRLALIPARSKEGSASHAGYDHDSQHQAQRDHPFQAGDNGENLDDNDN